MTEFMSQHPYWTFFAGVWFGAVPTFIGGLWLLGKVAGCFRLWR